MIKKNLNINYFLDYRNVPLSSFISELSKYIDSLKAKEISELIIAESNNYYIEIENMGLMIA